MGHNLAEFQHGRNRGGIAGITAAGAFIAIIEGIAIGIRDERITFPVLENPVIVGVLLRLGETVPVTVLGSVIRDPEEELPRQAEPGAVRDPNIQGQRPGGFKIGRLEHEKPVVADGDKAVPGIALPPVSS